MKLIAGLGNPGPAYSLTRHNVGFWVCDKIAEKLKADFDKTKFKGICAVTKFDGEPLILLKPATFMNLSGLSVSAALSFYKIPPEDLLVIHDDVDLAAGRLRLKFGGGTAGHKGLDSILAETGTDGFHRLRFGVGRPENPQVDTADFVLSKMNAEEREAFSKWTDTASDAALCFLKDGLTVAQNRFHAR